MILPSIILLAAFVFASPAQRSSQTTTGSISIFGKQSGNLGYLSTNQFAGIFSATTDYNSASIVILNLKKCSKLPTKFNIKASHTNGDFPYLGGVAPSGAEPNSTESNGFVYVVGTTAMPVGAKPSKQDSTWSNDQDTESALWSIDCTTNELSGAWISSITGMEVPLTLVNNNGQYISALANTTSYRTTYGSSPEVLTFTFIPLTNF